MKVKHKIIPGCFIFTGLVFCTCMAFADESRIKESINTIVSQLEKKYSVSFVFDSIPASIWKEVTCEKVKTEYSELLSYLEIFSAEFNKYPPDFVKRTNLKYVAFVRVLKYGGQHRSALPDAYKEILYLDILRGKHKELYPGNKTKYYLRHTIHHEYYHMIEQEINGDLYYKDSIWNNFNPPDNQYGSGGASMYPDATKKQGTKKHPKKPCKITHPRKGIITTYAATGLEEDKAEVFATLFVKREMQKVKRCMKSDEVVQQKVNYLKHFIANLCKEMDDSYWKTF